MIGLPAILLVLAVVFLVLGFAGVIGLVLAIGIAVACVVAVMLMAGGVVRGVRRW